MPTIETIRQAVHTAAAQYPVKRVELFGSYADGTADEHSDVDFLVEFSDNPTSLLHICGFRNIAAHQYGTIDFENVYKTVTEDIPVLKTTLMKHDHTK